jgi:tetratricopeptide (TPR) repeat protein
VAGAAEYELSVRGDVKFRATLTCPDAASGRCRAAYPASQPELPPGGIVSLRIAPRRSDGPHLGGGGDEVLWVRRLPDAEAAPILEGVKLIEQAPADGATRSLLLANLYAGHRLYADAILHYRTAAAELRGGEIDAALGDAYLATGLLEQAEDAYEDAVRDPAMLPTAAGYFGLGHVFYARGEFRQAGEQFDHAARIYEGEGFKNHGAAARVAAAQAWERAD